MAATDYNKLTVIKLKEELDRRGLQKTGLKAALVKRLEDDDVAHTGTDAVAGPEVTAQAEEEQVTSQPAPEPVLQEEVVLPGTSTQVLDTTEIPTQLPTPSQTQAEAVFATPAQDQAQLPTPLQTQPEVVTETIPASALPVLEDGIEIVPSNTQSVTVVSTQTSLTGEEFAEDRRKRKRRSQSPPPSSVDTPKRIKGDADVPGKADVEAQNNVSTTQIVDQHNDDAKPQTNGDANGSIQKETTQSAEVGTKDVKMSSPKMHAKSQSPSPTSKMSNVKQSGADRRFATLTSNSASTPEITQEVQDEREVEPAIHPATSALYIRNLMRPININTLKSHLATLALPPAASNDARLKSSEDTTDDIITQFHIDAIRTHALVLFRSSTAAARVRAGLHNSVWPLERDRKALWIDFIPEEKVGEWIEIETEQSGGRGSTGKRWEVFYDVGDAGDVTARLQVAGSSGNIPVRYGASVSDAAQSGRKGEESSATAPLVIPVQATPATQPESREFKALDDLFSSTLTKPKLYFLPVESSLAAERLDKLADGRGGGRGGDEMRRFTFEEGILVDRGPEFGRGGGGFGGGRGGRGRDGLRGGGRGNGIGYGYGYGNRGRGIGYRGERDREREPMAYRGGDDDWHDRRAGRGNHY